MTWYDVGLGKVAEAHPKPGRPAEQDSAGLVDGLGSIIGPIGALYLVAGVVPERRLDASGRTKRSISCFKSPVNTSHCMEEGSTRPTVNCLEFRDCVATLAFLSRAGALLLSIPRTREKLAVHRLCLMIISVQVQGLVHIHQSPAFGIINKGGATLEIRPSVTDPLATFLS